MSDPSAPALEAAEVTVSFRARGWRRRSEPALDGVGVTVARGHTTGLVGESGAGKTTLGRAVLGLVPVVSGSVRLAGVELVGLSGVRRRRLAMRLQAVYQDPKSALNPSYPVFRSLAEPLRAGGMSNRSEIVASVTAALDAVGIDPATARRRPQGLSGGELQRICIARAIIASPEVVILDEAVSALDLSVQAQILNLLRDLQDERGLSYLFISHDLAVVRHFCHDVTVLYRGRVMERGSTVTVTASPAHPYTRRLLRSSPVADPVLQRRRQMRAPTVAARLADGPVQGCIYASRCEFAALECHTHQPQLREIAPGRVVACHRYPEWIEQLDDAP